MDNVNSVNNNCMLIFYRFLIVGISWIIIVTNGTSSNDLFKSTILFMLGLLYDYLCLNKFSDKGSFQKSLSYFALFLIAVFSIISFLGLIGILVQNQAEPHIIEVTQNAIIMNKIHFTKASFCWALLLTCIPPFMEFANPMIRGNKKSNSRSNSRVKTNNV